MVEFATHVHDLPEDPSIRLVRLAGSLDTTTSPALDTLLRQESEQATKILVDLSQVDYISSAGWGVFLTVVRPLRERGGDLVLLGMRRDVDEVFRLLEFQSILMAVDSVDELLAATR